MNPPKYFYKYRSLQSDDHREWVKDILLENRLWFPSPLDFNDPYDCFPIVRADSSNREWRDYIGKLIASRVPRGAKRQILQRAGNSLNREEVVENLRNELPEWMRRIGIGSLATDPTEMLMWTHYADSHRGVCLRFNTIEGATQPFRAALKVKYSENRPIVQAVKRDDMANLAEQAFLNKASCWSYEKEWRIIQLSGPGYFKFPSLALDAVIFGSRTSDADRNFITSVILARKKPTKLFNIGFSHDTFKLEVIDS